MPRSITQMRSAFPYCSSIRHQSLQHLIPTRAFATGRQTCRPERIQLDLFPELARQPTVTPLPGTMQRKFTQSNPHNLRIIDLTHPILGKQRHGAGATLALLKDLDGLAPGFLLAVIDLAQVERVPLHDVSAGHAFVFDQAVVAMLLAVFLSRGVAQKHNGIGLCTSAGTWE
jgi:hypothetical protein